MGRTDETVRAKPGKLTILQGFSVLPPVKAVSWTTEPRLLQTSLGH